MAMNTEKRIQPIFVMRSQSNVTQMCSFIHSNHETVTTLHQLNHCLEAEKKLMGSKARISMNRIPYPAYISYVFEPLHFT